ncbi:hypothetical protein DW657_14595 [Prevotella sp. AM23-5]|nr:hypothetical protein DW657_14595 [Prevotella sp. AM23-5]
MQSRSNHAQIQIILLWIYQLIKSILCSSSQSALIEFNAIVLRIRSNNRNLIETISRNSSCLCTKSQYLISIVDFTKLEALSWLTLAVNQLYLNQRRINLCWVQRNIEVTSITALTEHLISLYIPILVTLCSNTIERRSQLQIQTGE